MSAVDKVTAKLTKADESLQVYFYDNGFMVEVGGRDSNDNWATAKILCGSLEEVNEIVAVVAAMSRS
jgi:hypothetical protein